MKKPYEVLYVYKRQVKPSSSLVYAYSKEDAVRVHGWAVGETILEVKEVRC